MPSLPFLEDPIVDHGVALRDAAERDIPEILIAHQDDPELHIRQGLRRPPSGAELGRQIEEADSERRSGIRARLTILEGSSDQFRGRIVVHNLDWEDSRAELGVWVVPAARGRGLARAALRLAARWLFERVRLVRLELLTEPDNEPMLRAAAAAGFVHEGVLRHYARRGKARQDMAVLSLLPTDLGPRVPGAAQGAGVPGEAQGPRVPGAAQGSRMPGEAHGSRVPGEAHGSRERVLPRRRAG
jgi:RimJ/RimL family protein N-acetyltransferase